MDLTPEILSGTTTYENLALNFPKLPFGFGTKGLILSDIKNQMFVLPAGTLYTYVIGHCRSSPEIPIVGIYWWSPKQSVDFKKNQFSVCGFVQHSKFCVSSCKLMQ